MTKEQFIEILAEQEDIADANENQEKHPEDNFFSVPSLLRMEEKYPSLFPAFEYFGMTPSALGDIVSAIGGGEKYHWEHIPLITALPLIYDKREKWERSEEFGCIPSEMNIKIADLYQIMDIALSHVNRRFPELANKYPEFKSISTRFEQTITLDRAVGHIIHSEMFLVSKEYLETPPGGDDTYFDYYPGDMYYITELIEWFLGPSEIRMF